MASEPYKKKKKKKKKQREEGTCLYSWGHKYTITRGVYVLVIWKIFDDLPLAIQSQHEQVKQILKEPGYYISHKNINSLEQWGRVTFISNIGNKIQLCTNALGRKSEGKALKSNDFETDH